MNDKLDSALKLKIAPKLDHANQFAFTSNDNDWVIGHYPTHGLSGENWTEEDWQKAIDIFEDRLRGRYFNYIDVLIKFELGVNDYHAGFLITALDCLVVETLQQFYEGRDSSQVVGKSFETFLTQSSFKKFFGTDTSRDSLADLFYKQIRCGILHQAEVKTDSKIVSSKAKLIEKKGEGVKVNRRKFHNQLIREFKCYVKQLRKPKTVEDQKLRQTFRQKMDYICKVREPEREETVLYFAYGSNMKSERLKKRAPSATSKGIAYLPKKRLVFNKISTDGSGKANIVEDPKSLVWGVLFEIKIQEMDRLDKNEAGYQRMNVNVKTDKSVNAITYISFGIDEDILPFDTYKTLVVEGANEFSLPSEYIVEIENMPCKPAPKQGKSRNMEKK
jgi:gamma-glutamylcyclotransferase (GGCT)/AIG2-like uncharacterized protein YtfP